MAIPVRDPDDHDPARRGKKERKLPQDEVTEVAQLIQLEMRHLLKQGEDNSAVLRTAIAVTRKRQDRSVKTVSGKGGTVTGKQKTEVALVRYGKWCAEADKLITSGKDPRSVAGILAERHGVPSSTIRRGLRKARTS